ncbi:MAG TPA: hypothetical protein VGT07_04185 [Steroidobacteraceae bacterium]|nr:hypothetical protein [Steroidobacteraceae bacterium]
MLPLAGGLAGGAALWSAGGAAGAAPLLPLDIEPELEPLSDGAAAGGAAGALLCVEAGGAAAGSVPEESFFAHAVSSSAAAASALRATLVFIDRYPDTLLREPIRRKLSERRFLSSRESFTNRAAGFYRVIMRLETV